MRNSTTSQMELPKGDICVGVICPQGKKCVKKDHVCEPSCICINDVDIEIENGTCRNHNFCLDPQPSFCPLGQYKCTMHGFRNYTCECPKGFFYNATSNTCVKGSRGKTKCVCKDGFEAVGATVDENGRLIEICEDINECEQNPCPTVEECLNTPGFYICGGVPTNATCPEGSLIVVTGPFSYRCECSWIYGGTGCRFPLTLILLILVCIFLLATIGAVIFAFARTRRTRTGTYQLYNVPNGM
uniref:EGF-like domain-containing protein n=1 Tax=Angiostrongylus cantonensis TaxID=6313 RepID=A0A158P614_ANGCA